LRLRPPPPNPSLFAQRSAVSNHTDWETTPCTTTPWASLIKITGNSQSCTKPGPEPIQVKRDSCGGRNWPESASNTSSPTPWGSPSCFPSRRPTRRGRKGSRDRAWQPSRAYATVRMHLPGPGARAVAAPGRHRERAGLPQGLPWGKRAKSHPKPGLGGPDLEKGIGARRRPRPPPLWRPLASRRFRYHGLRRRIGISPEEEYRRLEGAANEARVRSGQARLALEQHMASHHC